MLGAIRRLGDRVDAAWARRRRAPGEFHTIAAEALSEARLHERYRLEEILNWLRNAKRLPEQLSLGEQFGQPPLTLLRRKGFLVDLYYWLAPATSIHSHGFRGAFTVLEGTSLHCEYRFDSADRGAVRRGRLRLAAHRLLRPGEVEAIRQGTGFIHQVWHLGVPTVSLVVRTDRKEPQFSYFKPGLALRYRNETPASIKRLGMLRMLHRTRHPGEDRALKALLSALPPQEALLHARRFFLETKDLPRLSRALRGIPRLRRWAPAFLAALKRERDCEIQWGLVPREDDRLALALLHAGAPAKGAVAALRRLSGKGALPFALNATALEVLGMAARGLDEAGIAREMAGRYEAPEGVLRRDVRACLGRLRARPLLKPLLQTSPHQRQ